MQITIDNEFKRLIPVLLPEEFKQLEVNILQDGAIKMPLAVWGNILLDGHNRLTIAEKHGLPFTTTEVEITDRDCAKLWIINHQLGRRNLPLGVKTALVSDAARLEEKIKATAAAKIAGQNKPLSIQRDNVGAKKTAALSNRNEMTYESAAKKAGISPKAVRQFRNIEKNAPEVADMVRAGLKPTDGAKLAALPTAARDAAIKAVESGVEVRAAVRAAKKQDYNNTLAANKPKELEGTYRILYADPPWKYVGLNQADEYGHAERHYDCLDDEQLKKYKIGKRSVKDMMDKNAVLFLWVTSPLLERCFSVIEAWGFEYKSSFVWDKVKHNMGHYNSVRHELLLVCVRGACKPDVPKLVDSVQSIERSNTHSEKPEEFRKIIDNLYNYGRRLELFHRGSVPEGWDTEGNEAV